MDAGRQAGKRHPSLSTRNLFFFSLHPFQQREVLTAEKETAVKYKGKDKKETEAFLSETKDDLGTTQEELDAVTAKMTFCGDRDTFQSICANTVER